ncbi:hypothetical protein [Pandoraea pnomenusa]|uniref:hypothetical protein n=1 Tax=Pandoraea pnomenusa TaxID=93220 RepID=UPI0011C07C73|nr:hypothetical protein [Pandoraea pnomenusa]
MNSAFVRTMLNDADHHEQCVAAFNGEYLAYLGKDRELIGQILLSHLIIERFLDRYLEIANPNLSVKQRERMGFAKKWEIKRLPPGSLLELHGAGVVALNALRNKVAHDLSAHVEPSDVEPIKSCFGPWHFAGLSVISCSRHMMLPRRMYASQTESPAGRAAGNSRRAA